MYSARFYAVSGSDWGGAVEAINDETNVALTELDDAVIEIEVQDRDDAPVLEASTADGTITRPASGQFRWLFSASQLSALERATTYRVGCRMITDGGTTAIFTGSLAFVDGEIS